MSESEETENFFWKEIVRKPKENAFRDFHLLAISHIPLTKCLVPFKEQLLELKTKLDKGKKEIRKKTKYGDVIGFESHQRLTFEEYTKLNLDLFEKAYGKKANERLSYYWENIDKFTLNFYAELAEFARENGRKVVSLESGLYRPGSKLWAAALQRRGFRVALNLPPSTRLDYISELGRDIRQIRRIQQKKPKMVIVARSHAAVIEYLEPKRGVEYYPSKDINDRKTQALQRLLTHGKYKKWRVQERAKIKKELKLRSPKRRNPL
ncbi:hypothetical protein KKG83_05580 [Candidatus Micrarchaeota archaeon]|nr:hypothetical protein [Candidatus Micrarchaeota archaeon]MBU2476915.1 hypothetical protein [Candidatus Micrarchaeota archaeon]